MRDATSWDEVVTKLGYEQLKRHGLRHTGLTWMADAGVPLHSLRKIAGHGKHHHHPALPAPRSAIRR
ncbi:tyrosine-type recombinase/integrase [Mycobacterium marinum]|uniref:tyrosine-type recombinase/integrase n=1 Tax=Mycobacterium marinum TaxID=1781 RepID=UPI0035673F6B